MINEISGAKELDTKILTTFFNTKKEFILELQIPEAN
jgi:hypothetical protein